LEEKFRGLLNPLLGRMAELNCFQCGKQCLKRELNALFAAIPRSATLAIYGVGLHTRGMIEALDYVNQTRISRYADIAARNKKMIFGEQEVLSPEALLEEGVDAVILSSHDYQKSMRETLLAAGFREDQLVDLHTLEKKYRENNNTYDPKRCMYRSHPPVKLKRSVWPLWAVLSTTRHIYELACRINMRKLQRATLYALIREYLSNRDLVNAGRYIRVFIDNRFEGHDLLATFIGDVEKLLQMAKKRIQMRKNKAVLIYLFEGLEPLYIESMPYLRNLRNKGLSFDHAFTQYGQTTVSMQSMFTGKDLLAGRAYEGDTLTEENSPLLRLIRDNGFEFHITEFNQRKLFTGCGNTINHSEGPMGTFPKSLWKMLTILLSADRNQVILTHVMETHHPYSCGYLDDMLPMGMWEFFLLGEFVRSLMLQRTLSYVDEQLAYYDDLLPGETTRIAMGDHGGYSNEIFIDDDVLSDQQNVWNRRTRIALIACSPTLPKGVCSSIFSTKDFDKFFEFLLGKRTLDSLVSEYAKVYTLPYYDKELLIDDHFPWAIPELGVVTLKGAYWIDYHGRERYYPNTIVDHIHDPACLADIEEARKLCGNDFHGLFDQPKFALAKQKYKERGLI
jgi:hypothetical protein